MWQSRGLFQFDVTFILENYRNDFGIWRFYRVGVGKGVCVLLILLPGGSYDIHRTHRLRWDLKVKDFTFLEAGNENTCVTW